MCDVSFSTPHMTTKTGSSVYCFYFVGEASQLPFLKSVVSSEAISFLCYADIMACTKVVEVLVT